MTLMAGRITINRRGSMKKYFSIIFALAAITCISCTKEFENQNIQAPTNSHVVFKAQVSNNPLSKVTLTPNDGDTVFSSAWEDSDNISLWAYSASFDEEAQADWNPTKQAFEGDFAASAPAVKEEWIYEAKFPYDADGDIPFGSVREQKGNAYNSAYDIMYGTVDYTNAFLGQDNSGNVFVIPMTRLTGIAYFHITGGSSSDDVLSATLTVNGGNIAAETVAINTSGPALVPTNGGNSITINFPSGYRPKANDIKLWFNVLPGTYSGLQLTIKTASKTSSIASNKPMTYNAGELNKVVLAGLNWVNYDSHSITWSSSEDWTAPVLDGIGIEDGDYLVELHQAEAGTAPTVAKANDARVYASGEATITYSGYAMSKIVFNLSTQGTERLGPITASTGTISTQSKGDNVVIWTGKAKTVTFTVPAKATLTDTPSNNAQLCFNSIDIETVDDGLADAGISFAQDSYTALSNAAFDAPTLNNPNSLSVTYSSTTPSVATINETTGAITVIGEGATTIEATFAGDATYRAATASYTLTVADPSIVPSSTTPEKAGYADNSTVTFTVNANCSWEAVPGTDANTIIKSVSVVSNTVTVTFKANAVESEKTATVNLNQTGADSSPISVPVTVTQMAKPGAATVGTTLWSEDFEGREATGTGTQASFTCNTSNVYGGATVTYTFTDNGTNRTAIYTQNSAGGTSPELLIGKSSGTFTVSGIPSGAATGMTLTYVANGSLSISSPTGDVTVDALSTASNPRTYRVNNPDSEEFITLVFSNTSSSNVRIDNIVLEAGAPEAGVTVASNAASAITSDGATMNGTITLVNGASLANVTAAGFYYKKTSDAGAFTKVSVSVPLASVNFSKAIDGLDEDEEYTFKAYAEYNSGDEVESTTKTFTPTETKPSYSVTYTQTYNKAGNTVATTGTAPTGSSCSWTSTYNNSTQLTGSNTMTYTLTGFDGKRITGLSLYLKTNSKSGSGSVSMKHNSTEFGTFDIPTIGGTYELKSATVTATTIGTGETVTVEVSASANSVYCQYITITYE